MKTQFKDSLPFFVSAQGLQNIDLAADPRYQETPFGDFRHYDDPVQAQKTFGTHYPDMIRLERESEAIYYRNQCLYAEDLELNLIQLLEKGENELAGKSVRFLPELIDSNWGQWDNAVRTLESS